MTESKLIEETSEILSRRYGDDYKVYSRQLIAFAEVLEDILEEHLQRIERLEVVTGNEP